MRENVTKVRFTAFSISSMHMNMIERAAPREQAERPDAEEERGDDEVPGGGDVHALVSSFVVARSRARHASTAPTTAMMSSADVTSKAKRYVVKTAVPSWCTFAVTARQCRPRHRGRAGHPVRARP